MAELRYNPLLRDWTMVSAKRQNRPNLPKTACPFCPGSGKMPDDYDVYLYENDFPVLSAEPPEPDPVGGELYQTKEAHGRCQVVLYSSDHHASLPNLSKPHMEKLIELWTKSYAELAEDPKHNYVMIFENKGEEVGATISHPHGQIYAYPFVPLKVKTELDSCQAYWEEKGQNLFDAIIAEEKAFAERVIVENETFIAFIPFFTDYPFGVHIVSKAEMTEITEFSNRQKIDFADILQIIVGGMNHLYDRPFPYMMTMHQSPIHEEDTHEYYRFHVEFYPPLRDSDKIKFNASSETGGWAAANPRKVEETAHQLREAVTRYKQKGDRDDQ